MNNDECDLTKRLQYEEHAARYGGDHAVRVPHMPGFVVGTRSLLYQRGLLRVADAVIIPQVFFS